jgi:hypothetical protein
MNSSRAVTENGEEDADPYGKNVWHQDTLLTILKRTVLFKMKLDEHFFCSNEQWGRRRRPLRICFAETASLSNFKMK